MSPEVLDLWDRAGHALHSAEKIVDDDPDGAASRAYYAALHAVSAFFAVEGRAFRKHTAVEAAVHRDLVRNGGWPIEFGAAFSTLASLRQTGDYGGSVHVTGEAARDAVAKARIIVEQVRAKLARELPGL